MFGTTHRDLRCWQTAFTLVELLVVVTIIVVLLALLAPAMDQAIYQAELAVCATNHRSTATGAITYATDQKRFYPLRGEAQWTYGQSHVISRGAPGGPLDDRPRLSPYMDINRALQCPMVDEVDLANHTGTSIVQASYFLWFGWNYVNGQGMRRLGDRWTWKAPGASTTYAFSLLTGGYIDTGPALYGEHPDSDGQLQNVAFQDETDLFNTLLGGQMTFSIWFRNQAPVVRGTLDLNYGLSDGSVSRIESIGMQDEEMTSLPIPRDGSTWPQWQRWAPER
jgi:prepilin-type N-terminal cleavage/methylation domain-containing protein